MPARIRLNARRLFAGFLGTLLFSLPLVQQAVALNLLQDSFLLLSARPLGMGGACCAVPQSASVFTNPAGLAILRCFGVMHNHSGRHFPGSRAGTGMEWDQLDGDTQAIVVPLPVGTYAHGLTLGGEMGYDYRNLPSTGTSSGDPNINFTAACKYPRAQYWGSEAIDAYAAGSLLPFCAGIAHRRHHSRFTPDPADPTGVAWFRFGEGQQWGLLAKPLPGVSLGRSKLAIDYNFVRLPTQGQSAPPLSDGAPDFSLREKVLRTGWLFQPCGWLRWARDSTKEHYRFVRENAPIPSGMEDREVLRSYSGAELQLGNLGTLRGGNFDGHPTVGFSANLLGLGGGPVLNYAEVGALLPDIVGAGQGFENVHIYGFETPLF